MSWGRVGVGLVAVVAAGALLLSGGSGSDPETPAALPGLPPPFLGVAVLGEGGLTAAVDAYGDVVDLRAPGPAGRALIENPAERQAAGTVPEDTGIQVWARVGGEMVPMWRADSVRQRYLPGTNVLRTVARFGTEEVRIELAAHDDDLAIVATGGRHVELRVNARGDVLTRSPRPIAEAAAADRRWLRRAPPLAPAAPAWAERMYERSLLVLHALTDGRTGAVAAGARDGWAYVWPRDASAVAIALADTGYRREAELIVRFLLGAGIEQAARFRGDGSPVPGRAAQGDAIGWVAAAAQATGIIGSARQAAHILAGDEPIPWRDRADYWEGEPGDYLGNAVASAADGTKSAYVERFSSRRGLVRRLGDPKAGFDSAAAWAVRPFSQPRLYPAARRTMERLVAAGTPYGITPGEGWEGGEDPWSAPTAWTAWSLAALGERQQALRLMNDLRRAATPAGALPERVDVSTGIPTSTTPLAWSHAFAILALRELWPS
jgi:Glycosyl hydrolases family 15